jgi:NADH-quinone oxidoreductase subunit L
MENYPSLVTLILFIPFIGFLINVFFGKRLGESWSAIIGSAASILGFVVALLLWNYLGTNDYQAAVVSLPFVPEWINIASANFTVGWQMRVDTLSVTMMMLITGVGSIIHIYSAGYMHGDARFHRFFAYLNLFVFFMLILVTGNNFLMMFVGWEGVGLCSYLLIGFWFDRKGGLGWKNSNAAKKAMIANRVGDFALLMAIFLMVTTFGTLDYYRPGEIANVEHAQGGGHGEEDSHGATEGEGHSEEAAPAEGHSSTIVLTQAGGEGEGEGEGHGETTEAHGATTETHSEAGGEHGSSEPVYTNNDHIATEQLGVFGQAERMMETGEQVDFGPFSLPIADVITLITLFMLVGATGKSAQIPLFVWLPDAMAGPTPASSLIHAATMVTAGIYMMVRANVWFYMSDTTSFIVALIGASTAVMAGYVALGQWDIKRVLAYSTVSQLGFMIAAVGIGAYSAAMFHLLTHAFFKALLFMGSGSVIHAVEHGHHLAHARKHGGGHGHGHDSHDAHDDHGHDDHEEEHHDDFDPQDMRNMGGLARRMPVTFATYLLGTLALAGIWPLAGFWSKDEILADALIRGFEGGSPLRSIGGFLVLGLLLIGAAFTAFYMWRQIQMVFFGQPRTEAADHAPESSPLMTIPLVMLAVLSVVGGFLNLPAYAGIFTLFGALENIFGQHVLTDWLIPTVVHAHAVTFQPLLAIGATVLALGAMFVSNQVYGGGSKALTEDGRDPLQANPATGGLWELANARLYWDQAYDRLFVQPFIRLGNFLYQTIDWDFWHDWFHNSVIWKGFNAIGELLSKPVDLGIIDGTVKLVGRVAYWISGPLRRPQTGYVRTYAVTFMVGVVVVIVVLLLPLLQR